MLRHARVDPGEPAERVEHRSLRPLHALQFGRSLPARIDAFHVRKLMSDALVAVDAGGFPGEEVSGMDFGRARSVCFERSIATEE